MSEFGPLGRFNGQSPIEIALTQLGVKESAPNRGQAVDMYLASVGLDASAGSFPWCVAFVYHCCHEAGRWFPMTASVHRAWEQGKSLRVSPGRYGDVAIHLRKDGTGHCGFVLQHKLDAMIETVEGNTDDSGGREGGRVMIRTRPLAYWTGFLRPHFLAA